MLMEHLYYLNEDLSQKCCLLIKCYFFSPQENSVVIFGHTGSKLWITGFTMDCHMTLRT